MATMPDRRSQRPERKWGPLTKRTISYVYHIVSSQRPISVELERFCQVRVLDLQHGVSENAEMDPILTRKRVPA